MTQRIADPETDPAVSSDRPAAPEAAEKPPSWSDHAVALAGQLGHPRYSARNLAQLRRLNPENPDSSEFYRLLAERQLFFRNPERTAQWAALTQSLAWLTPNQHRGQPQPPEGWWPSAHDPRTPLGQVLYRGSAVQPPEQPFYSELRLNQLLTAAGADLRRKLTTAARLLGQAGCSCNCRHLAELIFSDQADPERRDQIRIRIARAYHNAQFSRPADPAAAGPGEASP